jgi:hypothetical protein
MSHKADRASAKCMLQIAISSLLFGAASLAIFVQHSLNDFLAFTISADLTKSVAGVSHMHVLSELSLVRSNSSLICAELITSAYGKLAWYVDVSEALQCS